VIGETGTNGTVEEEQDVVDSLLDQDELAGLKDFVAKLQSQVILLAERAESADIERAEQSAKQDRMEATLNTMDTKFTQQLALIGTDYKKGKDEIMTVLGQVVARLNIPPPGEEGPVRGRVEYTGTKITSAQSEPRSGV
jgi:hypothetical protein